MAAVLIDGTYESTAGDPIVMRFWAAGYATFVPGREGDTHEELRHFASGAYDGLLSGPFQVDGDEVALTFSSPTVAVNGRGVIRDDGRTLMLRYAWSNGARGEAALEFRSDPAKSRAFAIDSGVPFQSRPSVPQILVPRADDGFMALSFAAAPETIAEAYGQAALRLHCTAPWMIGAGFPELPLEDGASFRFYLLPHIERVTVALLTPVYSDISISVVERRNELEMPMRNTTGSLGGTMINREQLRVAARGCAGLVPFELQRVVSLLRGTPAV